MQETLIGFQLSKPPFERVVVIATMSMMTMFLVVRWGPHPIYDLAHSADQVKWLSILSCLRFATQIFFSLFIFLQLIAII